MKLNEWAAEWVIDQIIIITYVYRGVLTVVVMGLSIPQTVVKCRLCHTILETSGLPIGTDSFYHKWKITRNFINIRETNHDTPRRRHEARKKIVTKLTQEYRDLDPMLYGSLDLILLRVAVLIYKRILINQVYAFFTILVLNSKVSSLVALFSDNFCTSNN